MLISFDSDVKQEVGVVVEENNNQTRYDDILLMLANDRQITQPLYQLLINLCNDTLKSKIKTMLVNRGELKEFINNNQNRNMAANEFVTSVLSGENASALRFLTCDVESPELEEYIKSLPKHDGSWLELETVLKCGDFVSASSVGGSNFAAFCHKTMQMHVIQFLSQFFNFSVTDENRKQVKLT